VVYLLDACQSAGQLPLDVRKLRCHFLTGTGRKFLRGPRGSGFLYVAQSILEGREALGSPAALDVAGARWTAAGEWEARGDARRYEEYEMSFAAKVRTHPLLTRASLCR
jgi:cysteine desulfurase / selenocysteine lyase